MHIASDFIAIWLAVGVLYVAFWVLILHVRFVRNVRRWKAEHDGHWSGSPRHLRDTLFYTGLVLYLVTVVLIWPDNLARDICTRFGKREDKW